MTGIVEDRRQYARAPARILLRYHEAEQFFTDYIQNISRGGLFVVTADPLPPGTQLRISFALPDCDESIETRGVVVHNRAGNPAGQPGMGIQFQRLDEETLQLIDAYVNTYLA